MSGTSDVQHQAEEMRNIACAMLQTEVLELTSSKRQIVIKALKRLCTVHELEWALLPQISDTVSEIEENRVIKSFQCVISKSIKDEVVMSVPWDITDQCIAIIISAVEYEYFNKSQNRNKTFTNAEKYENSQGPAAKGVHEQPQSPP